MHRTNEGSIDFLSNKRVLRVLRNRHDGGYSGGEAALVLVLTFDYATVVATSLPNDYVRL